MAGMIDPNADPKGLAKLQSVVAISRSCTANHDAAIFAGIFK
eukprot:CAMPEP_0174823830 /NCGR_PEP_ID=MMETSP1107-20130205/27979_1 /TAXON_ID=36770 /ORGANISM="Paraphysomonas vestita, Strain GFlagA" /LENGTH=41 /DNA_ID= /DNA_START= /DNA_END= /DNA_ORIENTATION=